MSSTFEAELVAWEGPSAWHFVGVPPELAPDFSGAFGRVPVTAEVDGRTWSTSIWRGTDGRWLLAIPKKIRGRKGDGDWIRASIEVDADRI
ncbi:MAG: DUF1905 domain-containing protein [Actinomycetes bacterium]